MAAVRIGVLGAAKITPTALLRPARAEPDVVVTAVAARDRSRAAAFAARHAIPTVHDDYAALLADPDIDAVYNPLPNGLHARWTLAALAAGKHVLCEKPFTANEAEARQVAEAATASGKVVMEAFHFLYHPLAARMADIVATQLGEVRSVSTALCFPLPRFGDIRYSYDLGGGATMDAGCYALRCLRLLGPGEPEVISATAALRGPTVDRAMRAWLRFPGGASGEIHASLWSRTLLGISARVEGTRGSLQVFNYVAPQLGHRLTVRSDGRTRREHVGGPSSYAGQLAAFAAAVLRGEPTRSSAEDAVLTMRLIDAVYRAAGLPLRGA